MNKKISYQQIKLKLRKTLVREVNPTKFVVVTKFF